MSDRITTSRCSAVLLGVAIALGQFVVADDSVQIEVIEPVYRRTIYATESNPRIELRASGSPGTARLVAKILDEQRSELARTEAEGNSGRLSFKAADLPLGTLVAQVSAIDATGKRLGMAETAIRKVGPSPGSEVRIDRHGNVLVDGRAQVFIGWYGDVTLEDPRPDVVKLQNCETAISVVHPDKREVSRKFKEHGIRTIVTIEPGRLLYAFELWKTPNHPVPTEHTKLPAPSLECRDMVRRMVELLRDEPGLLGWYIADEPEINNVRADYLEAYYQLIAELDPYHLVVVTNDTLDGIDSIGAKCCDILSPDPYSPKPAYVPSFMQRARAAMRPGQGLFLTPWTASGQVHFTGEFGATPPYSYRVMRGQHLAALAYGARGFTGYASTFFLPEPRLRIGLPHLWREIRALEPALVAAPLDEAPVVLDMTNGQPASDVVAWVRQHDGHEYAIVMNFGAERKLGLRHSVLRPGAIGVISEGRELGVDYQGTVIDVIPAGETRVLSTNPELVRLPTVDAVDGEIDAFERAVVRPGNLLHYRTGTRARASKGTTPWFAQEFYYAINGIDDDQGWHVTHAELPQHLELSFPDVKKIGRVVVKSPNLRDFDLHFRGADGKSFVAEIRDETRDVATIALDRPVSTLKLRIVARATRAGATIPRAMVREIEAYADAGTSATVALKPVASEAAPPEEPDVPAIAVQPPLWAETFEALRVKPRHYEGDESAWVMVPSDFEVKPTGAGLECMVTSAAGYASMGRLLPVTPEARWLQVSIPQIEGDGYKWLNVSMGDPSGKRPSRGSVHTIKPGIYTIDAHALNDGFADGSLKTALVQFYLMKGIRYRLERISLGASPKNSLFVTLPDGRPLPRVLKEGDQVAFRVDLEQPAEDVIVELERDSWYEPVRLNGDPYVQLLKSGKDKDGRLWSAVVRIGANTDKFKTTGYPLLLRATVTGGAIRETLSTVTLDVE